MTDPSVVLGDLSKACLIASTLLGYISVFYPYDGKSVPRGFMFKDIIFTIFFSAALLYSAAATNVLWDDEASCSECLGEAGNLEGGGYISLGASLLWWATLAWAGFVREEYFYKPTLKPFDAGVVVNCCNGNSFLLAKNVTLTPLREVERGEK